MGRPGCRRRRRGTSLAAAGLARRGSKRAEEEKRLQQQQRERERGMERAGAEVYEGEFAGFGGVFWESVAFGWDLGSTMFKDRGQWYAGTV
jgi:hypothetical protein